MNCLFLVKIISSWMKLSVIGENYLFSTAAVFTLRELSALVSYCLYLVGIVCTWWRRLCILGIVYTWSDRSVLGGNCLYLLVIAYNWCDFPVHHENFLETIVCTWFDLPLPSSKCFYVVGVYNWWESSTLDVN